MDRLKLSRGENKMFNLTNKAKDHFLNFFKSEDQKEEELKDFLKAEYKKDYAKYVSKREAYNGSKVA